MKARLNLWLVLMLMVLAIPAFSDDQQKAEKQLHKLTAMASDPTGRRVVSVTVADALNLKRPDLVTDRRTMNLNYGDLILARQLVSQGVKMDDIAAQLKAGKKMPDIANAQHINWKQVASDAKKMNSKMEDTLYKNFINGKPLLARDQADNYDVMMDGVPADSDVSKEEVADAEHTYQMWRDRALAASDSRLDTSSQQSAESNRGDPARAKLPGGSGAGSGTSKQY